MSVALRPGVVAIGGRAWLGGANYVRNLASAVRAASPGTPLAWVCGDLLGDDWHDVTPRWPMRPPSRLDRVLRRHPAYFRRRLEDAGLNFLYPLTYDNAYNLGLGFPLRRALGNCRWAGWIPDFQHRHLPEFFTTKEVRWRDAQIAQLVREAPRVVLSSQSALDDFRNFHPQHASKGIALPFRVQPTEPGHDAALAGGLPERFFLVCNQFWKHKNHTVIFEALRLLRARGLTPPVLCTGAWDDYRGNAEYVESLRALLAEDGVRDQVHLLGVVPRERVTALLRRALAVIQPSLFEGWSTVVEDARALGRPCLLSDLPVHREQNPPGAKFFPPRSPAELADLIEEAWRTLAPGPDAAAEAAALATARAQHLEFGREFIALAECLLREG